MYILKFVLLLSVSLLVQKLRKKPCRWSSRLKAALVETSLSSRKQRAMASLWPGVPHPCLRGHLRASVGYISATRGHLNVTVGHFRVTSGHLRISIVVH